MRPDKGFALDWNGSPVGPGHQNMATSFYGVLHIGKGARSCDTLIMDGLVSRLRLRLDTAKPVENRLGTVIIRSASLIIHTLDRNDSEISMTSGESSHP
jgi:hypothetical protein